MNKEDEVDIIIRLLCLPGKYNIELNLSNLKIKYNSLSSRYEVEWSKVKPYHINNPVSYQIFTKIVDAVEFFVDKRYELKLGEDFEI